MKFIEQLAFEEVPRFRKPSAGLARMFYGHKRNRALESN
jgi:hypothetical protein